MADEAESIEHVVVHVEEREEIVSDQDDLQQVVEVEHVHDVEVVEVELDNDMLEVEEVHVDCVDAASRSDEHCSDKELQSNLGEPESYVVNTIDIETSDSSPAIETDFESERPRKKVKPARTRKTQAKTKTKMKQIKEGRVTRRSQASRNGTETAVVESRKQVGRKGRQSVQAQLKKEKIRKANLYLRKGLDDPTSAPEVANIPELERLKCGLEDLASGKYKTVSAAAAYWRVHAGKLYRRHRGDIPCDSRHGPAPVLTGAEEADLGNWILMMSQRGFQVSAALVRDAVQSFFKRDNSPFINGRPSYRWYYSFLRRNSKLREMKTSNLTLLCDANPSKAVISEWFQELTSFLVELGIADRPAQIFNYAETGFEMNKNTDRIVISSQTSVGKSKPTCLKRGVIVDMCIAADGRLLPPFIMYRGQKHMPHYWDPLDGATKGSRSFFLEKDGDRREAFSHWIEHHFVKSIGRQRPVILLLSCPQNEISYKTYVTARQNDIHLFRIPPKAAYLLQPLDVAGEAGDGPFKSAWIMKWVMENRSVSVNFSNVARVISCAWKEANNSEAVRTCFIQSGIHPLDRGMIDDDHLAEGNLDFLNKDVPKFREFLPEHVSQTVYPKVDTKPDEYSTSDTTPNVAEAVFHKLDEKLDKTTRETYRVCIKSGLDLEETPLFSVWKRLYLEAYRSESEISPRTGKTRTARPDKRQSPRSRKANRHNKDDVFCPVCDERYGDDGGEDWIGCDGQCQSWYHVNCLPPEVVTPALLEDKEMVCPDCLSSSKT